MKITHIDIGLIDYDKNQPRKDFQNIRELSRNITKHGLISPIEVRIHGEKYIVIDGERRLRALKLLKNTDKVPCIIRKHVNNIFLRQVITDFHKHKLDLIEQAEAIKKLKDSGMSSQQVCKELGIGKGVYFTRLKVLKLNSRTQKYIKEGKLNSNDVSSLSIVDMLNEDKVVERIINEKPKSRAEVEKIVYEETDVKYIINVYLSNCYRFEKIIADANSKILLFKNYINKYKEQIYKENNELVQLTEESITKLNNILGELKRQKEYLA